MYEVMDHYQLTKQFRNVQFFHSDNSKNLCSEIQRAVEAEGQLISLTAITGSGKTRVCQQIKNKLQKERKVLVSTSWSAEKEKVKLGTLIVALFADLATDKNFKMPSNSEIRERRLQELIKKRAKPVVLFVDEAHKLYPQTLFGLKNLMEVVWANGGSLSIVLVGLPKLTLMLKNPAFEEIGTRVQTFTLNSISGEEKDFLEWMLDDCTKSKVKPTDVFTKPAINLLGKKLKTPLQIIHYSWKALEMGYKTAMKPVDEKTVREILAPNLHNLEATLVRQGFSEKALCDILDIKRREVRAFLKGKLSQNRMQELHFQLLELGIVDSKIG